MPNLLKYNFFLHVFFLKKAGSLAGARNFRLFNFKRTFSKMSTDENPYAYHETEEDRPPEWRRFEFDFGEVYAKAYLLGGWKNKNLTLHLKDNRLSILYEDGRTFEIDRKNLNGKFFSKFPGMRWYHSLTTKTHNYELRKIAVWATCDPTEAEECREMILKTEEQIYYMGFSTLFYFHMIVPFWMVFFSFMLISPFGILSLIILPFTYFRAFFLAKKTFLLNSFELMMKTSLILAFLSPISFRVLFHYSIYYNYGNFILGSIAYAVMMFGSNFMMYWFHRKFRNKYQEFLNRLDEDFPIPPEHRLNGLKKTFKK